MVFTFTGCSDFGDVKGNQYNAEGNQYFIEGDYHNIGGDQNNNIPPSEQTTYSNSSNTENDEFSESNANDSKNTHPSTNVETVESANIEDITDQTQIVGEFTYESQKNIYKYVPSVTGEYNLTIIDEFDEGLRMQIRVENSGGGYVSGTSASGIGRDNSLDSIELNSGEIYYFVLTEKNGFDNYILSIGIPNETKDITGQTQIEGAFTYENQKNTYKYVPSVTGEYNLAITGEFDEGLRMHIRIENSGGGYVSGTSASGIERDNSLDNIELNSGEIYYFVLTEKNGFDNYILSIGIPNETKDITGQTQIEGAFTYENQKNTYKYVPSVTGEYNLAITGEFDEGLRIHIRVENSGGGYVSGTSASGIGIDNSLDRIKMSGGEIYYFVFTEKNGFDSYIVNIGI